MIARAAELASVLAAGRRGEAGVVVSAARGMGRTTLADAAIDALRAPSIWVRSVSESETVRAQKRRWFRMARIAG